MGANEINSTNNNTCVGIPFSGIGTTYRSTHRRESAIEEQPGQVSLVVGKVQEKVVLKLGFDNGLHQIPPALASGVGVVNVQRFQKHAVESRVDWPEQPRRQNLMRKRDLLVAAGLGARVSIGPGE